MLLRIFQGHTKSMWEGDATDARPTGTQLLNRDLVRGVANPLDKTVRCGFRDHPPRVQTPDLLELIEKHSLANTARARDEGDPLVCPWSIAKRSVTVFDFVFAPHQHRRVRTKGRSVRITNEIHAPSVADFYNLL